MVEKIGHKKIIAHKRLEWINEGKPKPWEGDDALEENVDTSAEGSGQTETPGPNTETGIAIVAPLSTTAQRPKTPEGDIPDEDDIYGATPEGQGRSQTQRQTLEGPENEEDDVDALMAEADAANQAQPPLQQQNNQPARDDFADKEAAMAEMDGLW